MAILKQPILALVVAWIFLLPWNARAAEQEIPAVQVDYKINHLEGLVNFGLALAGEPHQAPGIFEAFRRSRFNTATNRETIDGLKPLHLALTSGFQFNGLPSSRRDGAQVIKLILTQSLFAKDLDDLSIRSLGLMPPNLHRDYFAILKKLEPVYDALIWQTSLSTLKRRQNELVGFAKKSDLNRMFNVVERFYRGVWPLGVPFSIGLYPVPHLDHFKNYTFSQSLGSIEEHGILIGTSDDDTKSSFGVIFHELCHSLYRTQSNDFTSKFENWFRDNPSPFHLQAYVWLNEALPTAIGNGWALARANGGKLDTQSWYDSTTIDGFAKALYPMVHAYLGSGRVIDETFAKEAISIYAKRFPESLHTFENNMNTVTVLHEGSFLKDDAAFQILTQAFSVSSFEIQHPLQSSDAMRAAGDWTSTLILILNSNELSQIEKFLIPENPVNGFMRANLKLIEKLPNHSFFLGSDSQARPFVIINASNASELRQAVDVMLRSKTFDLKNPVKIY